MPSLIGITAVAIFSLFSFLFWSCATTQKEQPTPQPQLSVLVESSPAGAEVFLDTRPLGKTPLSISLGSVDEALKLKGLLNGQEPVEKRIRWIATDQLVVRFRFGEPTALMKKLNLAKALVFDFAAKTTFDVDRSDIKPEFEPFLVKVAELIKNYFPALSFHVCGHTDASGGYQHNLELSLARATAVRQFLASRGISPSQMTVFGLGPDFPEADNATPEGRALNRRTELVLPQP